MSGYDVLVLSFGSSVAILLLVVIIRRTGEFLNAAVLFSTVWAANLVCCVVLPYQELRLQLVTLAVAIAAWWAILVGFLGGCLPRWPLPRGHAAISPRRGVVFLVALIGFQVVSVILEAQQTGLLSSNGSILAGLADLPQMRLSGVVADVDIPRLWKLNRWNYTLYLPLAFVLFRARVLRLRWLVVIVVVALISAILKFTRAPVLNVVTICIVGMWAVRSETTRPLRGSHRRLTVALVLLVGFVLLFGGMQAALVSKMDRRGSRTGEALLAYVGGPLRAYEDVLLKGGWGELNRIYSIDFVEFVAFKAGLKKGYEGQVRPYTDFGIVTNVYTYLDAFTLDAGVPGALLGSLGLGILVGWLFDLARRRRGYWGLVMYSHAAYNCVMAGANNQFIQFSFFLDAILAWFIVVGLTVRLRSPHGIQGPVGARNG